MIAIILFFILMLIFLVYIFLPLMKEIYWPYTKKGELAEIRRNKKEGIRAISDIDFEFEMGKLTGEDYASTREFLKKQAVPALEKERDFSERLFSGPKKEISKKLKKEITGEVLRICGKKLSS